MKTIRLLFVLSFAIICTVASGQNSFQKNRKAFQKVRFNKTTTKYGRACEIFEKKRTKGPRKPLIDLGFRRKSSRKAEQN